MDPSSSTPSTAGGYPMNFLAQQQHQQHQHQQQFGQQYGQQLPFQPGHSKNPSQTPSQVPFSQPGAGGVFPQHSSAPHATFTAPFAQPPVPSNMNHFLPPQTSNAPSLPTSAAQPFPQNMASMSANSMVGAPPQQQQQPQQHQQRPVQQPLPQSQPQLQSQAQPQIPGQQLPGQISGQGQSTPGQGTPQMTPQSGPAAAREKARVSVLLDINSILLQEVVNLQNAGKAGAAPQQPPGSHDSNPSPGSDQGAPDSSSKGKPSPEYIECMRRLQANLAYLATIADRAKKSGGVPPQAPAIMTPPPNLPSLVEVYSKLNELFPRLAKSGGSGGGGVGTPPQPSPQSSHGNGKPSPSPAAEFV